jgi:hypothetical protein
LRRAALGLLILSAAALAAQDVTFRDAEGAFGLFNFTESRLRFVPEGIEFEGAGQPLLIQMRHRGLEVRAASARGAATRQPETQRLTMTSADLGGGVHVTLDSAIRDRFVAERTSAAGGTPSPGVGERATTLIRAASARYRGDFAQGTYDIAGPLAIDYQGLVAGENVSVTQTVAITGGNAQVSVDVEVDPARTGIRTGMVEGPVAIKIVRRETGPAGAVRLTEVDAVADRLEMDMTGELGVVRAIGGVRIVGTDRAFSGEATAAEATITVTQQFEIREVVLRGAPVRTVLREGRS